MLLTSTLSTADVALAVIAVSESLYGGNVRLAGNVDAGHTRDGRQKVRFTLTVADSYAKGARTAASGRHIRAASWDAHRDVMAALFDKDPNAKLHTAMADYNGREHFHATFGQTAYKNIGSQMQPAYMPDLSV